MEEEPASPEDLGKSETDPEFRNEDGSISQEKYLMYLQQRNKASTKKKLNYTETPTSVELIWVRVLHKISEQAKWIKASEYKLWPGVQFPTDLSDWKYRMIEAYIEGSSDAEAARIKGND